MTFYLESVNKINAHNGEVMASAGDSMLVLQGVTVGSSTDWDGVDATANCSIQVFGTIMSIGGNALYLSGGSNEINVGSTGSLIGNLNAGAALNAAVGNLSITNSGQIVGKDGIYCGGGDNMIFNSGYIGGTGGIGAAAIYITGDRNTISNSGTIEATHRDAILIDAGGGVSEIDNSGVIRADPGHYAVNFAGGGSDLINTGHIVGDIQLGYTNSIYDGAAGTIDGTVFGGPGEDTITMGVGRDFLIGESGADTLEGGPGRDIFQYIFLSDSTGSAHDLLVDFDFKRDVFSFNGYGSVIDPLIATGKLRSDHFNADLQKAANAAHLGVDHMVLFTPSSGSERGEVFMVVDANAVAGYQANADFVVELHHPDNIGLFSLANFI